MVVRAASPCSFCPQTSTAFNAESRGLSVIVNQQSSPQRLASSPTNNTFPHRLPATWIILFPSGFFAGGRLRSRCHHQPRSDDHRLPLTQSVATPTRCDGIGVQYALRQIYIGGDDIGDHAVHSADRHPPINYIPQHFLIRLQSRQRPVSIYPLPLKIPLRRPAPGSSSTAPSRVPSCS